MIVSALQYDISWESPSQNYKIIADLLVKTSESDIILLPEMWSTGFSMDAKRLAESMEGPSVNMMKTWAKENNTLVVGSLIIEEEGKYFNRMLCVTPEGEISTYDKRHLFSYAGEDKNFTAGGSVQIVEYKGWKILPQICYDLRFPSFMRFSESLEYDLIIYCANWPHKRALAWKTLLKARAIENQSYVIGLNRIGLDGNNVYYSGDSQFVDFAGAVPCEARQKNVVLTSTLDKTKLKSFRAQFPFLEDRDIK